MGQPINLVAQAAMDDFYGNYKSETDFYTLDDFIDRCSSVLADVFQKSWEAQYNEMRSEKREELVTFDPTWLNEQILEVKNINGEYTTEFVKPVMSFLSDRCSAGVQFVFSLMPNPGLELERISLAEKWQLKLSPHVNKGFFTPLRNSIVFTTIGDVRVSKVRVLYIPKAGKDMDVPDGLIDYTRTTVVAKLKGILKDNVIKKSIDGNQNEVMQTEINKMALK
jgi:hypothetical protein